MKKNLEKSKMTNDEDIYNKLSNMPFHHLVIKPDRLTPYYSVIFFDRMRSTYVLYVHRKNEKTDNNFIYEKSPKKIYKLIVSSYKQIEIDLFYPYYWLTNKQKMSKINRFKRKNLTTKRAIKNLIMNDLNVLTLNTFDNAPDDFLEYGEISV